MPNRREFDHIGNFMFKVEIEGVTVGRFLEVEGLESATEVIISADGDNSILRKTPGRTNYSNLILRRGFTTSDELWKWRKRVIDGVIERKSMSIIFCDEAGTELLRYNAFEVWPCRWKASTFRSMGKEPVIEEIELAIEKIERG